MRKVKIIVILLLASLLLASIVQNSKTVSLRFLFTEVEISLAILLIAATAVGFMIGLLTASKVLSRKGAS